MKQIQIADTTLCAEEGVFGFKEKLEIARQLEKLEVDVVEFPEIENSMEDILLVRTASSFVRKAVISVAAGSCEESVKNAIASLSQAEHPRIRIEVPMSAVGMEYIAKKKADAVPAWVAKLVGIAKEKIAEVEFCALDATRSDKEFLLQVICAAKEAGATHLSICDGAAEMLPDDFSSFVSQIASKAEIPVAVSCSNKNGLAAASSVLAARGGAVCIKTDVSGICAPLEVVASTIKNCGRNYGFSANLRQTELNRIAKQILWVTSNAKKEKAAMTVTGAANDSVYLDSHDDANAVNLAVFKLGYSLSEEDQKKVYEEFLRVAKKKAVGSKELDAIVASVALQVPATYCLASYVVNNGNIISASAQITLTKGEEVLQGVCIGDGPVDAAFRAIDQIIGHHYELDDFQIQSVTEGKEAMGSALVKLRAGGKLYSGNGISTDIIGASIRAYLNAVNKIIYEEA